MITKINLNCVASYKTSTALETDKKVNLIYGLNGTGKSTLSNFLYKKDEECFKDCSIEGLDESHELLVYNNTFIQEIFFEADNLKGIFTLSKENKEAEIKIADAYKKINYLEEKKEAVLSDLNADKLEFSKKQENAKNAIWKIKTDYSGGDRVLEFCLDGYKGSKDALFHHVIGLAKTTQKPANNIEDLKNVLQSLSGDFAQKYISISEINISAQNEEISTLLLKEIVGNENSTVSQVIKQLGNSDWVKKGLDFLPKEHLKENCICPFCQKHTISETFIGDVKQYFDASYEADINSLKILYENYSSEIASIPNKATFEANPKFESYRRDFEIKYDLLIKILQDNKKLIEDKIRTPSVPVKLESLDEAVKQLNNVIKNINIIIYEHNRNIDQKEIVKTNTKKTFWELMRWDYDLVINQYRIDSEASKTKSEKLEKSHQDYLTKIREEYAIISEQQKQTVNIEEAIININNGLLDLGIIDFKIKKYSDNLYKIVRGDNDERIFRSFSEGEKMIISFLYFIELCRGKKEASDAAKKKIIVIDDPISSLSHVYVFNVGRLIKNEFFGRKENKNGVVGWHFKYQQIFILTHSLYFFYEITETKHEDRKETQKLFRLIKNEYGSSFVPMSYEEIQNDYQSYWSIIKDEKQPPALIANCMRNIIEYFFNFVEKKDLNNFFQQDPLNSNRFQAFYRYINRESHSLGQNIFDFKEFNYQDFKDAFGELFKVAGYEDHYNKMIK